MRGWDAAALTDTTTAAHKVAASTPYRRCMATIGSKHEPRFASNAILKLEGSMTELELTRTPGDRRRYALEDVGTIHLEGLFARSANAEAGTDHWQFVRSGFWQRVIQATDATGNMVGEFRPRDLRRGGTLEWAGRELRLRPASSWRERYALADGDEELVILDGKSWGRRPVSVSIPDGQAVEPGLLLFACFVVRQLAVNAANDSAAGSTAAVSSTSG